MKLSKNVMRCITAVCAAALVLFSCDFSSEYDDYYRNEMRLFVGEISDYAKAVIPGFIIIPQNGIEIVTTGSTAEDEKAAVYLSKIDAIGQEDLFYGYKFDNQKSPSSFTDHIEPYCSVAKSSNVSIFVTDYCSSTGKMDDSYILNETKGYISFATDSRELDRIPSYPGVPYNENAESIVSIAQAKNFLYLINPSQFSSKEAFISAIENTNYDVLIIDAFFDDEILSVSDVLRLKKKKNGADRLVVSYMSIGEAEDYRYYWNSDWSKKKPEWLLNENPEWEGNYKVKYWKKEWQDIIYGNDSSYLKKIINSNFNGVYLDIIDAFEYFER